MADREKRLRAGWRVRLGLAALAIVASGCGGGQTATPEAVNAARQLWSRAGIRDYDLDWSVSGRNNAHYLVTVRDGEVQRIDAIQPDGGKFPLDSHETRMYGVDGLLRTIDEELAVCGKSETPFGAPKGTRVVMRFLPDEKLGYPHWYHRDVLGTPMSMAIEVHSLTPVAPAKR